MKKFIDVFGERYKIKLGGLDKGYLGMCDTDEKIIYLMEDQNDKYSTFIHELIHAIFYEVGLNQSISGSLEQIVCETISKQIAKTLECPKWLS